MNRGFVVTLDMMFALMIAFSVMSSIASMSHVMSDDFDRIVYHRTANDILLVLEKNGTIGMVAGKSITDGESILENSMQSLLPTTIGAEINVSVYDSYSGAGFTLDRVYTARYPDDLSLQESGYARRVHVSINDTEVSDSEYILTEAFVWIVTE